MTNPPPKGPQQQRQLRLELPATLNPTYANVVVVSSTSNEIVLDFTQILPNDPRARVQARIIMTPANAKLFLRALGQNIDRWEEKHGEINLPTQPGSLADQLFGGLKLDDDGQE